MSKQQQVVEYVAHVQQHVCKASYPHNAHASHQTDYLLLLLQAPLLLASHPSTRHQPDLPSTSRTGGCGRVLDVMSHAAATGVCTNSTNNRPWVRSRACKRALPVSVTCLPAARGRTCCNRQAEAQEGCGSDGVEVLHASAPDASAIGTTPGLVGSHKPPLPLDHRKSGTRKSQPPDIVCVAMMEHSPSAEKLASHYPFVVLLLLVMLPASAIPSLYHILTYSGPCSSSSSACETRSNYEATTGACTCAHRQSLQARSTLQGCTRLGQVTPL